MKSYRWVVLAVVLSTAVALVGAGPASAEGNVTYVTGGTEVPASDAACAAAGGFRDVTIMDGACVLSYGDMGITDNGKHFEGVRLGYWRDDSPDPRLTGYNTVESHIYLNLETGAGHIWGTFNLLPDGDAWAPGTGWQGTWEGQFLPGGTVFMVGHGDGTGSFAGLKLVMKRDGSTIMVITTGG